MGRNTETELRRLEERVYRLPVDDLERRVAALEQGVAQQSGRVPLQGPAVVTVTVVFADGTPGAGMGVAVLDSTNTSLAGDNANGSGVATISVPTFLLVGNNPCSVWNDFINNTNHPAGALATTVSSAPVGSLFPGSRASATLTIYPGVAVSGSTTSSCGATNQNEGTFTTENVLTATTASWGGGTFDLTYNYSTGFFTGCFVGTIGGVSTPIFYQMSDNGFITKTFFLTNAGHTLALAGTCANASNWAPTETSPSFTSTSCKPFAATGTVTSTQFPYNGATETISIVNKHGL